MVLHFGVSSGNFGIYGVLWCYKFVYMVYYGDKFWCTWCIMVLNFGVYGVLCMNMKERCIIMLKYEIFWWIY
mgnify:CR=1 FL=1